MAFLLSALQTDDAKVSKMDLGGSFRRFQGCREEWVHGWEPFLEGLEASRGFRGLRKGGNLTPSEYRVRTFGAGLDRSKL
jgi:hypothetical protein